MTDRNAARRLRMNLAYMTLALAAFIGLAPFQMPERAMTQGRVQTADRGLTICVLPWLADCDGRYQTKTDLAAARMEEIFRP